MFTHYGIKCHLFEDYVHTPTVPYSTIKYNCLLGIMVTASHNPRQDNGYKVYWGNGAQIIEPHDRDIRDHIYKNLPLIDLSEHYDYIEKKVKFPLEPLREKTLALYLEDALKRIKTNTPELNAKCKPFVYTAMHGVGYIFAKTFFHALGFKDPVPVKEQIMPDADFPTVDYPNPEEGEPTLVA